MKESFSGTRERFLLTYGKWVVPGVAAGGYGAVIHRRVIKGIDPPLLRV